MTSAWAFVGGVFLLVIFASLWAHEAARSNEAIRERDAAIEALHEDNATLRRYLDKRNHQVGNLVAENYEMHLLIRQAREQGFVPRKMREGREN